MDRLADEVLHRLEYLVGQREEALDVEFKGPLDLTSEEHKEIVAKAILAMANHGGGYVVIGVLDESREDSDGNTSLPSHDDINNIVKSYADPVFHCNVHRVCPDGHDYAVIVVPGGHPTPIRAKRDGPKKVKVNSYYVRKPGPCSETALTADEWNKLIQRCTRNSRNDLLDQFRAIMESGVSTSDTPEVDNLEQWVKDSTERLFERVKDERPEDNPYELGYWSFSYRIVGGFEAPPLADLNKLLMSAESSQYTGRPPWPVIPVEPFNAKPFEKAIEAWLYDGKRDYANCATFWRAAPDGKFFQLDVFEEDFEGGGSTPGSRLDATLPIWRIGERLLHASRMAQLLSKTDAEIEVLVQWSGLKNRELFERLHDFGGPGFRRGASLTNSVEKKLVTRASSIEPQLPELVLELTKSMFEAFEFYTPSQARVRAELRRMTKREY